MSVEQTTTTTASESGWDSVRSALAELNKLREVATSPLKLFGYLRQTMTERPVVAMAAAVIVGAMLRKRFMHHN